MKYIVLLKVLFLWIVAFVVWAVVCHVTQSIVLGLVTMVIVVWVAANYTGRFLKS